MSGFKNEDTDCIESDFLPGEIVTLRCRVAKCKPDGERNLSLEVDDGSGRSITINSQSSALKFLEPEAGNRKVETDD